jgi:uncharacterized protein YkwD
MKSMMRVTGLVSSLALATGVASAHPAHVSSSEDSVLAHQLLGLINRDREDVRLAPLELSAHLSSVADAHSIDMAEHSYFAHVTPTGLTPSDRMLRAHIRFHRDGENLGYARGYSPAEGLQIIEMIMMQSPHHRANLLNPGYRSIGIGVSMTGRAMYVTEDFTG